MTNNFKSMTLCLRVGYWEFSPRLPATLLVIILLPLLLSLGFWQLQRAEIKQQLLDQFNLRSQQSPQRLADSLPIYTPIQITGYYDSAHSILLDNRIINHQLGYDVFVSFIPNDSKKAIWVNLGWVPKSEQQNYQTLISAKVDSPTPLTITGLVQKVQNNFVLSHSPLTAKWPLVVEDMQMEQLSQFLNRPFYPFILLLSSDGGFTQHWNMVTTMTPERHRGYAVQWFALALTLVFLYFKVNIRRFT